MPVALHQTPGPVHVTQRQILVPRTIPAQELKPQVICQLDRTTSNSRAASSGSSSQTPVCSPASALLMPLQQSLASPQEAIEQTYLLSAVAEPPNKFSKEQQEYTLQFGHALRTLRDDIPLFFKQAQQLDIFTEDVVFVDEIGPRLGLKPGTVHGKSRYSRHLWALRLLATVVFSQSEVEVQRFWQRSDKIVAVRWVMHGRPRLLHAVGGTSARLDGISEFRFNSKGFIYQHTVDCINWDGLRLGLREQEMVRLRANVARVAGIA